MDEQYLSLAQYVERHPLLTERESVKIGYLQVLEYFQRHFSEDVKWTKSVLALYIQQFGVEHVYKYDEARVKQAMRHSSKTRIRGFKLFTYRYALVGDILFMNSVFDKNVADQITQVLLTFYTKRSHSKIAQFVSELYTGSVNANLFSSVENLSNCWKQNVRFQEQITRTVLISANMSAGKSTLINALIGKRVNRTQNEACTAKLHLIYNKPFEDGFTYESDFNLVLNAGTDTLMTDNGLNENDTISVGTFFRTIIPTEDASRLCLIDTPGVNSSTNTTHSSITYSSIAQKRFDSIVIVMNAAYMGTDDDKSLLQFVQTHVPEEKVVFVINQLDRAKLSEDSISDTIEKARSDLTRLGFSNPCLCPVSAYAGLLAKKKLFGELLDEDEEDAFGFFKRLFKQEEYDLSKYYSASTMKKPRSDDPKVSELAELLLHTGIIGLEHIVFQI